MKHQENSVSFFCKLNELLLRETCLFVQTVLLTKLENRNAAQTPSHITKDLTAKSPSKLNICATDVFDYKRMR